MQVQNLTARGCGRWCGRASAMLLPGSAVREIEKPGFYQVYYQVFTMFITRFFLWKNYINLFFFYDRYAFRLMDLPNFDQGGSVRLTFQYDTNPELF